MRFDQCTETCTSDCGHCKGQPVEALRADNERLARRLAGRYEETEKLRDEVERFRSDADRSWKLLADARTACKRLTAGLIANAGKLDVPFTDMPDLSPWSRTIKPAIDGLRAALGMRGNVGPPCCDFHNRNCEPPSELCCEYCTEAHHPHHADASVCIAPELSSPPLAAESALASSRSEGVAEGRREVEARYAPLVEVARLLFAFYETYRDSSTVEPRAEDIEAGYLELIDAESSHALDLAVSPLFERDAEIGALLASLAPTTEEGGQ